MAHVCYHCNSTILVTTNQKIGFKESCHSCSNDLHVCRNCQFYDPAAYNLCREPNAERVVDKERANYCDYFHFRDSALNSSDDGANARKKLDDLFK